ncbi:hypothetical protein ACVGVM_05355 [Pseudonocardia bannensis]|uniref:Uncharacterized protein n=1 Tax=Pseudonocardia bannensis TaxID=630973 RepID=A0A848DQ94_9PSEU|nr:hypothetical protein [Pseudonocardia bannensis]NMH94715.1 hypothetical protein [Pseudonocardia bannensis]
MPRYDRRGAGTARRAAGVAAATLVAMLMGAGYMSIATGPGSGCFRHVPAEATAGDAAPVAVVRRTGADPGASGQGPVAVFATEIGRGADWHISSTEATSERGPDMVPTDETTARPRPYIRIALVTGVPFGVLYSRSRPGRCPPCACCSGAM